MTPTSNATSVDALEPSDSDTSDNAKANNELRSERTERPTRKKRFPGSSTEERTLLRSICKEALSDDPRRYRKAIATPHMIGKFRQKIQNEDIADDDLRKIATRLISSEYLDQHPDHPSEIVYQPGLVNQYGDTPSASPESIYTPARRTPREVTVTTTTTKIAKIMQEMGVDQTQAPTRDDPLSPTVTAKSPTVMAKSPTPIPPDTSVQNLEESFNDYATEQSTPNTDNASIPKIEESFQENVTNEAIDMQVTNSLATSGRQYIDAKIKLSITQHIKSESMQDRIRDATNQHMKKFIDTEGSLQEQHTNLSAQLTNLKEQMSEGFWLLAELKNTNQDLHNKNLALKEQNATILQDTFQAIEKASRKQTQTADEQLELLTTRGLANAERSVQSTLRRTTKTVYEACKLKITETLASYDIVISDKYDEHIEKGTDLLYEMGNTIKTSYTSSLRSLVRVLLPSRNRERWHRSLTTLKKKCRTPGNRHMTGKH